MENNQSSRRIPAFTGRLQRSRQVFILIIRFCQGSFLWWSLGILLTLTILWMFLIVWKEAFTEPECVHILQETLEGGDQAAGWQCLDGRLRTFYPNKDQWLLSGQDVEVLASQRDTNGRWLVVYGITKIDTLRREQHIVTFTNGKVTSFQ